MFLNLDCFDVESKIRMNEILNEMRSESWDDDVFLKVSPGGC